LTTSLFKQLEELKKSDEVLQARDDFEFFCKYVYGYDFYEKQREIAEALMDEDLREILIEAPRGSGKSELVTIAYQSWVIGRDHDERIITCSNTLGQAQLFLSKISAVMRSNPQYKEIFGELAPKSKDSDSQWTNEMKTVINRSDLKDPTMIALGRQGNIVGRRATLIICDDIIDSESVLTQYQREKISRWFKEELYPCLLPDGRIIVIGTRYHQEDIYDELEKLWGSQQQT
jgi:hypothetical protein